MRMLYFYEKKMEIDNILLLRTFLLVAPYIIVALYFHYKVRDKFFLKPRTHIQMNLAMIFLTVLFLEIVYWNISLRHYSFMSFGLSTGTRDTSNTILVLLGILAAVIGWIFQTRGQSLNSTRTHSIQTLMESRLSEIYIKQVEKATEIYNTFKTTNGETYNLQWNDFKGLNQDSVNAIYYLLNYLEFVSVGVRFNDLDEKLMKNMMKSIMQNNFTFFEEIIKEKQKTKPSVFEHLTALNHRWSC